MLVEYISNQNEFDQSIAEVIQSDSKIIGVDGEDGIGKTSLVAPNLAKKLFGNFISVDKFLEKDRGQYAEFIDYQGLKTKALQSLELGPVIIEGILLLKILERLQIKVDKFIYVTGESWFMDWERYKELGQGLDSIIHETEQKVDFVDKMLNPNNQDPYKMNPLRAEVYEYTYNYKPMTRADGVLVFRPSDWWKGEQK